MPKVFLWCPIFIERLHVRKKRESINCFKLRRTCDEDNRWSKAMLAGFAGFQPEPKHTDPAHARWTGAKQLQ